MVLVTLVWELSQDVPPCGDNNLSLGENVDADPDSATNLSGVVPVCCRSKHTRRSHAKLRQNNTKTATR